MQGSLAAARLSAPSSHCHSLCLPPDNLHLRLLDLRAASSLSASSIPSTTPRTSATRLICCAPSSHPTFLSGPSLRSLSPACQDGKLRVGAVSVAGSAGDDDVFPVPATSSGAAASGMWRILELGVLFAAWIIFNIYFNIYNKQVLKVYPFPVTVSAIQFGIGSVLALLMWLTGICKKPKLSSSQLLAILPMAVVHTLGNLFTNMSLGSVSVSFTHTVKAMEPFFSVLLSAMFLGQAPTLLVVASLVPVVGGVALASLTEVSFNWYGFWSAMASNLANQSRNVLSKKLMEDEEEVIDNITLFSVITIMSFLLLVPVTLVVEGVKFTPAYIQSAGLNLQELYVRSLLAGLCFHTYQQVAYMLLARVSPVTLSVSNCVKRVVVIIASVLFFRTPVSLINSVGTGIALLGVYLYSRSNRIKAKAS